MPYNKEKAIEEEIQLSIDKTWELLSYRHQGVIKKKRNRNNNVLHYKMYLVTKRYLQIARLDFIEIFAVIVEMKFIYLYYLLWYSMT